MGLRFYGKITVSQTFGQAKKCPLVRSLHKMSVKSRGAMTKE